MSKVEVGQVRKITKRYAEPEFREVLKLESATLYLGFLADRDYICIEEIKGDFAHYSYGKEKEKVRSIDFRRRINFIEYATEVEPEAETRRQFDKQLEELLNDNT